MSKQADKVIAIAKSQVGTKEIPTNKTKYGKWFGFDGQPWCAMFVSWCFDQAGLIKLIAQSPKGYAGCESFESWAKGKGLIVPVATVQTGDILLFDFSKSGRAEHTGIAIGYDSHTHLINTVEGNTADSHAGNQANGDGVFLKYRAISTIRAVIRPQWTE